MVSISLEKRCNESNQEYLLDEWHPTKNAGLTPADVSYGSHTKVWWICEKGHEWKAGVKDRLYQKQGCPYCAGKRCLKGYNDLETLKPEIAKDWHPIKNGDMKPSDFTYGSGKKVWWQCDLGHEWRAAINSRSLANTGCPICINNKVLSGYNDLQTTHPDVAKEWHPIKNGELKPTDVLRGSNKIVWWKCINGHEWKARICDRSSKGSRCPLCSGHSTSVPEQGIAFYLEQICRIEQRKKMFRKEIDVYLPDYKVGVEYDGSYYHTPENREKEIAKDRYLLKKDIIIIRLKESDKNKVQNNMIYFDKGLDKNYDWALKQLCLKLTSLTGNKAFEELEIDIQKDILKVREKTDLYFKEKSLSNLYPEIAKEWHPSKNGTLTPEMFPAGANIKVWWQCSKGHEWKAMINNRSKGTGCPICSNQQVQKGYNDLVTMNPEIAKEWHPTKNGNSSPKEFICGSTKKVWWLCSKGHTWNAQINLRTNRGYGCPFCANKRAWKGFNDLATTHPEIAKQWHPTKNGDLKPTDITSGSKKRIWWLCSKGHESISTVNDRVLKSIDCPVCSNKRAIAGINDLATTHPEIAKQWHPTKNGDLKPTDITNGSDQKVWWRCSKGHEWQINVKVRTGGKHGCPYCSNKQVLRGYNDLATIHSEMALEWHPSKNGDLKPNDVTMGSNKKVWWLCSKCGNEWETRLSGRHLRGYGCPVCSRQKAGNKRVESIIQTRGSLAGKFPQIAKEWHPTKNGVLKPDKVSSGSDKKVWWQCSKGHEWKATITSRVSQKQSCPICQNRKVLIGYNDLKTVAPEVAREWHPTKNGNLKPTGYTCGSHKRVWWLCEKCGNEWITTIGSRALNGHHCPICSKKNGAGVKINNLICRNGSLEDNYPNISKEWHPTKNGALKPSNITAGSNKKVWWRCSKNHEWQASVGDRTNGKQGCPFCIGKRVQKGFNDLATTHPELAKEWHPSNNVNISPETISAGSNKKVWWKCSNCGWEWEAIINNRKKGSGCPRCVKHGRKKITG